MKLEDKTNLSLYFLIKRYLLILIKSILGSSLEKPLGFVFNGLPSITPQLLLSAFLLIISLNSSASNSNSFLILYKSSLLGLKKPHATKLSLGFI